MGLSVWLVAACIFLLYRVGEWLRRGSLLMGHRGSRPKVVFYHAIRCGNLQRVLAEDIVLYGTGGFHQVAF